MIPINNDDFIHFVAFIKQNYGIDLSKKKGLIQSRLQNTIVAMNLKSFSEYAERIMKGTDSAEVEEMLSKLTTNYTYFMREQQHFNYFSAAVLPQLEKNKKDKSLAIWSAGCSSGEEPYTLSMILFDYFGENSAYDTKVLATDISKHALNKAKLGVFKQEALEKLPERWLKLYFIKNKDHTYNVTPSIRRNVVFREFNLMNPIQFKSKFDVIFCRNVMIYFDKETKDALAERFFNASNNEAYLFIGHSETLGNDLPQNTNYKYMYVMPAVYKKQIVKQTQGGSTNGKNNQGSGGR